MPSRLEPVLRVAREHPAALAAALYAGLSLLLVVQGLLPGRTLSSADYLWSAAPWQGLTPPGVRLYGANGELADAVAVFQPLTELVRGSLPDVPLWNPYIAGGRPLLADAQSAIFSPFSVPAYLLPFGFSLAVTAALKVWAACFGTFLLGRALGMRWAGAVLAGVVFGLSLWIVSWLAWPLTSVWVLLPWLLWAVERVVRRPGAGSVALLAVVVAAQFFGGHPESSFHILFGASCFLLLRLPWRSPERALKVVGACALGLLAGAGLAGVAIVPFVETLSLSGDIARRDDQGQSFVPAKYLGGLLLPDYWGRPTGTAVASFLNGRAYFIGILPLALAAAAVLLRPTQLRMGLALFGVGTLLVVIGTPLITGALIALPGFAQSYNGRLTVLFVVCFALLAGFGLDELRERQPARPPLLVFVAVLLLVVPPVWVLAAGRLDPAFLGDAVEVAWGFATPPVDSSINDVAPLAALLQWLPLALAVTVLLVLRAAGRLGPAAFAALALVLVVVDLLRIGIGQNPAIPAAHAEQPVTAAIERLRDGRPDRFAGLVPTFGIVPLPADVGVRYALYDARSYDYPVERRYDELWRRYVAPDVPFAPPTTLADATPRAARALGVLSTRSLLQQPGDPVLRRSWPLSYDGDDARIYANPYAVPRAYLVDRVRVARDGNAALDALVEPRFDRRGEVVAEEPIEGLEDGRGSPGTAQIARQDLERVQVSVRARRASLLVLTDSWYPGWKAEVDGEEAEIERVNYLVRGVRVPAGEHRVVFAYEPASWLVGRLVTAVSALGLGVALLVSRRRRRPA